MTFKDTLKKGSIIAVLGLGLSVSGQETFAASNSASQKLVDSLQALKLDHVDYLYAYLQSVDLSNSEYKGILANTGRVSGILNGAKNPENLPPAQKMEVLRLFVDSVKLAHLKANIVNDKGQPIEISTYKPGTSGLQIQLMDLKGNLLGTIDPTKEDLNPRAMQAKINALKQAVLAKKQLEQSGSFVPMPSAALPNTATDNYDYMLIGALIAALGSVALVPAVRMVRKVEA